MRRTKKVSFPFKASERERGDFVINRDPTFSTPLVPFLGEKDLSCRYYVIEKVSDSGGLLHAHAIKARPYFPCNCKPGLYCCCFLASLLVVWLRRRRRPHFGTQMRLALGLWACLLLLLVYYDARACVCGTWAYLLSLTKCPKVDPADT